MDDANVPSLLSLPYLGFLDKDHPTYVATRKLLLSQKNPYYAAGKSFRGIGYVVQYCSTFANPSLSTSSGPHVDAWHPW